jgi:hypothetical protein
MNHESARNESTVGNLAATVSYFAAAVSRKENGR